MSHDILILIILNLWPPLITRPAARLARETRRNAPRIAAGADDNPRNTGNWRSHAPPRRSLEKWCYGLTHSYPCTILNHFYHLYQSLMRTVHGESYACWDGIEDLTGDYDLWNNLQMCQTCCANSKRDILVATASQENKAHVSLFVYFFMMFHEIIWYYKYVVVFCPWRKAIPSRCQICHKSRRSVLALTSVVQSCQLCQHGAFDVQCDLCSAQFASYSLTTYIKSEISCKETPVFKNSHPTFEANACLSYFELQFTQGVMASLKLWPEDWDPASWG